MKKKVFSVIFTTACLLCCVIPFAGMIVAPSNEAIGNEQQTKLPSFKTENGRKVPFRIVLPFCFLIP